MKFEVKPMRKTDVDENIHEIVSLLATYFAENPDEPFVELIYERDGVKESVGRINNPQFTELIYAVSFGLDNLKRKNAVRTVEIRTK